MQVIPTGLPSVYILEPKVFGDSRGWFMETWSERDLERAGLHYRFVQDNQSFSARHPLPKGGRRTGKDRPVQQGGGSGCGGRPPEGFPDL